MLACYHTHTERCNHASGTDEEYVKAAIAEGVKLLGFSDHAPMPYRNGYVCFYKMKPAALADYCSSIISLREKYADKIDIKIGLESEYYPSLFEDSLTFWRRYPIDYLILGQHFVDGDMLPDAKSIFYPSDENKLASYVERVTTAIKTRRFSYLAHPDAIKFSGEDLDFYREQMRKIIKTAKSLDLPLEFNLLGMAEHRCYPNPIFWKEVSDMGANVILGCDAHSPTRVANKDELKEALRMADSLSLNVIEEVKLLNPLF